MTEDRLNYLKNIVNTDYVDRHDMPQMYFTLSDLKYLVEQAEKARVLQEEVEQLERKLETVVAYDVSYEPKPTKIIKLN